MRTYAAGIDVGGTKIAAGVVDSNGKILASYYTRAHAGHPPPLVVDGIVEGFYAVLEQSGITKGQIQGVGIGCAGHVNGAAGLVLTSSNLQDWENIPLRDIVAQRIGMPVRLDNDTKCAGLGEYFFGAGRGARYMCYVTFSTGYGMALIIDGKLYRGAIGTAGEIGHTVIVPDGELCTCGKRGCVMAYASGLALSRIACERVRAGEPTRLRDTCGETPAYISGEVIAEAAKSGDAVARQLIETAGRYFGMSLANIIEAINPEVIVIGGGLSRIGPLLLDPCFKAMRENIHPVLDGVTRIALAQLGDEAGLIGAATLVWEN
jgi:glucokinase